MQCWDLRSQTLINRSLEAEITIGGPLDSMKATSVTRFLWPRNFTSPLSPYKSLSIQIFRLLIIKL
jgi:hypothetical protein